MNIIIGRLGNIECRNYVEVYSFCIVMTAILQSNQVNHRINEFFLPPLPVVDARAVISYRGTRVV